MITKIDDLNDDLINHLVDSAKNEGFRFLTRLLDEWVSAQNTFSCHGEVLLGWVVDGELIAVGGVNRVDDSTGRLRRFYVMPEVRRQGVGRALLAALMSHAEHYYDKVVLYADTEVASRFYQSNGFEGVFKEKGVSHSIKINRINP